MKEKKGDKDVERFLEAAIDNNHSHHILFFRRRIIIALPACHAFTPSILARRGLPQNTSGLTGS
jgi:hypothetical protein